MTKEEIREEIEYLDDDVVYTIIECCKELYSKGVQLFNWDKYTMMELLDKILEDSE